MAIEASYIYTYIYVFRMVVVDLVDMSKLQSLLRTFATPLYPAAHILH